MRYDFIAEFYKETADETPIYKTHLNGINDPESFIRENGFEEVQNGWYADQGLETDISGLQDLIDGTRNPELLSICFEGEECKKIVIMAYEIESGCESFIGCNFGKENSLMARFGGNQFDSVVQIVGDKKSFTLPLKCFKNKYDVLTIFEAMDRIKKDYCDLVESDLDKMENDFATGIKRAIDIVVREFLKIPDLDGNSQLLHMTAVSFAGKTHDEQLVGLMHDLVEDTKWTFKELLAEGFSKRIVDTLRLLTHNKKTPYMEYIEKICKSGNKTAIAVKINDLNHNIKRGKTGGHWEHVAKHEAALSYITKYLLNEN